MFFTQLTELKVHMGIWGGRKKCSSKKKDGKGKFLDRVERELTHKHGNREGKGSWGGNSRFIGGIQVKFVQKKGWPRDEFYSRSKMIVHSDYYHCRGLEFGKELGGGKKGIKKGPQNI